MKSTGVEASINKADRNVFLIQRYYLGEKIEVASSGLD